MTAYADPPVLPGPGSAPVAGAGSGPATTRPLVLDAWAACSCPVKTQHRFDPGAVRPEPPVPTADDPVALRAEAQDRHRAVVLEALIDGCGGRVVDLRLLAADGADVLLAATRRALADGVDVVVGGVLPADVEGHRTGAPDLLVRGADTPAGRPGYHPALVVWHQTLAPVTPSETDPPEPDAPGAAHDRDAGPAVAWTPFAAPSPAVVRRRADVTLRTRSLERDLRRLAHHHRLLEAAGHAGGPAPGPAWGGLVGTDRVVDPGAGHPPGLVWCDLGAPLLRTYDPAVPGGYRLEAALERYDAAFARRVAVAESALRGGPLLEPVVVRECATCVWWPTCRAALDDDDVSLRIDRGALGREEVEALRGLGTGTVRALAGADLDELLPRYLPRVAHRSHAESRLRTAARRARLLQGGVPFVRETSGPIAVPGAGVEVDLDVESSADGRVYLWGFWVERPGAGAGEYVAFSAFRDLDEEGETALAVAAFTWLRDLVESEARAGARTGRAVAVYHYSAYEVSQVDALAQRSGDPVLAWASAYAHAEFVDLLDVVKEHWFGVSGLGLKLVATHAGFRWRDDDPGGLNSQAWFADAVHDPDPAARAAAEARVLAYNEDDVLATRHLRAWLRSAA